MKKITALILSILMLVSLAAPVAAYEEVYGDTTVIFSLTSEGENTIYAQTGEEITIDFSIINKTSEGTSFDVETAYNDIRFDNNFFEIDTTKISSSVVANAMIHSDSRGNKLARFNGSHEQEPGGLRTYASGEVVGTFKLTVKATEGQTTIVSKDPWLTDEGNIAYHIECKNLTVIIGDEPVTLYTVKYISEGSADITNQNAAGTITVGDAPSNGPANHTFKGWENNGTLYQPGASFELTGDTTFTAKWERIVPSYTLSFNTNGGSAVDNVKKPEGTVIDLSEYTTEKAGYTFDGWYEDAELTQKAENITLSSNITVFAKWIEAAKPTYTLTFNTNGGSSISPVTKEEGSIITLSDYTTSRSGYNFAGWYSDAGLTNKITTVTLNANTTVYANWTFAGGGGGGGGVVTPAKYTLSFEINGGTELDEVDASKGTKISLDKYVPEKEGYVFDGWYSDEELTKKITEVTLDKDITIYAKWTPASGEKPDYKPAILTDEHYAYIVGREGGFIAPESDITRAEVATIIYRLLNEDERNEARTKENVFKDVNEGDWFNTAVSTLASLELVKGRTEDTFAPDAFITRAELATIFARMVEVNYDGKVLFSDVSGHWAESFINEAATAEWIVGYNGLFRPDDNITRAEVMTLVNRVLNREPESKADLLDGMTTWNDNADETAWYYLAVQEATNSHTYEMKADGKHEKWTSLTEIPNWAEIE